MCHTVIIIVVRLIWFYCLPIDRELHLNVFIIKLAFFIVQLFIYAFHAALYRLSSPSYRVCVWRGVGRKRQCSYMQKLSILWRLPSVHKCDCWWILLPSIFIFAYIFLLALYSSVYRICLTRSISSFIDFKPNFLCTLSLDYLLLHVTIICLSLSIAIYVNGWKFQEKFFCTEKMFGEVSTL